MVLLLKYRTKFLISYFLTTPIKMKAVVFGGAGVVGSFAVKCLSEMGTFSKIIISDIAEARAKNFMKTNSKLEFIKTDATDEKSLSKSIDGADVAVNCVGPFYKFAPRILKTAISNGVNYVDVCDDYDVTEELLDGYNKSANDAGVTCIVGLGASPGLTNIIASFAAKQLDSVEDIKIFVTRGIEEEAGGAIPYHMLHCWVGRIPIFKNGKLQRAQGLVEGEEYVTFPEPFGQVPVYYFGHPETVTLPRYIKGVKNVCCKGTFFPPQFREALVSLESLGFLSDKSVNVQGKSFKIIDFTASYIDVMREKISKSAKNIPSGGAVMVEVAGESDGEPQTIRYEGTAHMRQGTGTPAAIGAKMLAEGKIKSPGVFAPEGCIPPMEFIMNFLNIEGFGDAWITIKQRMSADLL
jgi:saccharopine dehydrogenase (NAD+, L-lysine-forming)